MKTIWKWNREYENGWGSFETIWKLYENNMEMEETIQYENG